LNTLFGYLIIFTCMYALRLGPVVSNACGYGLGLAVSFLMHRDCTFRAKRLRKWSFLIFLVLFALSYLVNLGILFVAIRYLGIHPGISQVIAGIGYVATSYVLNKKFVFPDQPSGCDTCGVSP
jgi:putative flippase GtrA